jgi:two-component system nitrogen regulation sensor histidine kinase NtrY
LKLYRERREGRLGSQFKTRMVVGSIALTLLPTVMLFVFSFWLIDTTLRVFLQPTERVVDSARAVLREYVDHDLRDLKATARRIARTAAIGGGQAFDLALVSDHLRREARSLRLSTAELREGGNVVVRVDGPDGELEKIFAEALQAARASVDAGEIYQGQARTTTDQTVIFMVVGVPVGAKSQTPRGLVIVRRFPPELAARFSTIDEQLAQSERLVAEQGQIRRRYVSALTLVTALVLFATVWIALYVSRSVTEPIQALVQATHEVASGNLKYRIESPAEGELATLVSSFNSMSAQLGESRQRLIEAAVELESSNASLDERRAYIETVLAGLSTGVVSVDATGNVTMINAAAMRMLGLGPGPYRIEQLGKAIGSARNDVEALIRRARRSGTATGEATIPLADGSEIPAAVSVSSLSGAEGAYAGAVITVEDLSELIRAERAAAWSEVARRMAHEIKNPLTPIQLSAERIQRGYRREEDVGSDRMRRIVEEGTDTIVREVGALQHMVEEFSRYARLPSPRFREADLNDIVATALGLYEERVEDVEMTSDLAADLPLLHLDVEQVRRVIVNLVDNAIEALDGRPVRTVAVRTRFDARREVVQLLVEDSGHGVEMADRDNLFVPYFSTRRRGTGLGLAIVSHIVADHRGRIWVESNDPSGARFVVEFPVVVEVIGSQAVEAALES